MSRRQTRDQRPQTSESLPLVLAPSLCPDASFDADVALAFDLTLLSPAAKLKRG